MFLVECCGRRQTLINNVNDRQLRQMDSDVDEAVEFCAVASESSELN